MAATLRDVAARAGVSVRTVSNVVNDFHWVADDTRTKVRAALDELGYRPNISARNLRARRTGVIALGLPQLSTPYFAELAELVIEAAARHSYTVVIETTGGDPVRERQLAIDRAGPLSYDGLIFSPIALGYAELSVRGRSEPTVVLGERSTRRLFDHVGVDTVAAAREATTHLIATGHRRLAVIGAQPKSPTNTARYRLRGFEQAVEEARLRVPRGRVVEVPEFSRAEGERGMRKLLAATNPPDAVFCFSDLLALGALRAAADLGARVPDDVAVMGFDDIDDARFAVPALSTVAVDKAEIARLAVTRLMARLDGDTGRPADHTAPYRLVPRESTAPSR